MTHLHRIANKWTNGKNLKLKLEICPKILSLYVYRSIIVVVFEAGETFLA
jgi:hypothetical protein